MLDFALPKLILLIHKGVIEVYRKQNKERGLTTRQRYEMAWSFWRRNFDLDAAEDILYPGGIDGLALQSWIDSDKLPSAWVNGDRGTIFWRLIEQRYPELLFPF